MFDNIKIVYHQGKQFIPDTAECQGSRNFQGAACD